MSVFDKKSNCIVVLGNALEWCRACWESPCASGYARFFDDIPLSSSVLLKRLCHIHLSKRLEKLRLPFKRIWYKSFLKTLDLKEGDILLVYDGYVLSRHLSFFTFLKHEVHIKTVYFFTNIIKESYAFSHNFISQLPQLFDNVVTYDPIDAVNLGFKYHPLIYEIKPILEKADSINDLYFVGYAKNRYEKLIELFKTATSQGLKCEFHIIGVKNKLIEASGLFYSEAPISYKEVLAGISRSKVIVELNQDSASGFTLRVCEAVMFDKKLLSDNVQLLNSPLYGSPNIMLMGDRSLSDFIRTPSIPFSSSTKKLFSLDGFLSIVCDGYCSN